MGQVHAAARQTPEPGRLVQTARSAQAPLGLHPGAGNAAISRLVSQHLGMTRLTIQRDLRDDLQGAPTPVAAGARVDIPADRTLVTVGNQRVLAPVRVYDISQVPAQYDHLAFRSDSRHEFLPGPIMDRMQAAQQDPNLSIGDIRRSIQGTRRTARVAIAQWGGQFHLVGADSMMFGSGYASSGFVVTSTQTAGLGQQLMVARVRAALQAGVADMHIEVGTSDRTLRFHQQIVRATGVRDPADLEQNSRYTLRSHHMARLLAEWDASLDQSQRASLRAVSAGTAPQGVHSLVAAARRGGGTGGSGPTGAGGGSGNAGAPSGPAGGGAVGGASATPGIASIEQRLAARQTTAGNAAAVTIAAVAALADFLNSIAEEREHRELVVPALEDARRRIAAHQVNSPHDGALVRAHYRQAFHPDTPVVGPRRFGWIDIGFGRTREEALVDATSQQSIDGGLGAGQRWVVHGEWEPPRVASLARDLRTPFPAVGIGAPPAGSASLRLQDVKWDAGGFDDEGTSSATFPSVLSARVRVLAPPRSIRGIAIPVVSRPAAAGGSVDAVDLDTLVPGNAAGVPVFPLTEEAQSALASTRPIQAMVPLPPMDNLSMVRFVRPEDLRIGIC